MLSGQKWRRLEMTPTVKIKINVWCNNHFELHRRWNRRSQVLRHAPKSLLTRGRVVDNPIFCEQLLAGVQCVFNVAQERCDVGSVG